MQGINYSTFRNLNLFPSVTFIGISSLSHSIKMSFEFESRLILSPYSGNRLDYLLAHIATSQFIYSTNIHHLLCTSYLKNCWGYSNE